MRNALLAAALFATAAPAFAQAPTDAQKSAIRSACRSDYQAHCSSVTPGGAEALQCLQKNMSSLSSACQSAVRAVEPPAAPKAESAPAAPKAETAAPAAPSAAPAPAAAAAKPATTTTPAAPKAAAAAPAGATPAAAPAPVPTVIVLRPLRPREELFIVGSACGGDIRTLCAGVAPGGGRIAQCLANRAASLSPGCKDVLAPFAAR